MQRLFLPLLLVCMVIGACKKSGGGTFDKKLTGKWVYTSYSFGTGGPSVDRPADPPNQQAFFKDDGSFYSSVSFLKGFMRYEVQDSARLRFFPSSKPAGYLLMGYQLDTIHHALILFPVDPFCIEGCSFTFKRKTF